jgi:8-oxo-dGTP diphosphatase
MALACGRGWDRGPAGTARGAAFETSGVWDFRHDHVQIFELKLACEPDLRIDNREIVAARFETAGAATGLPLSPPVRRYLAAFSGGKVG